MAASMMIPAYIKPEVLMGIIALKTLTHICVHTHALLIIIHVPPELMQILTARNNVHALHVQGIMKKIVALWLQTAQPFANLTSKNAKHLEKMTMVVHSLLRALSKSVIITENFATYIAPVYVMIIRYYVQVEEMKMAAKKLLSVYHLPKSYGERIKATGVLVSVLLIAKIGSNCVPLYKTLVMDVQQNPIANQKLKTSMELTAHHHLPLMLAPYLVKLWTD